jgi:3-phenylpropionate/cinnamic acid dioxygenase small subunit
MGYFARASLLMEDVMTKDTLALRAEIETLYYREAWLLDNDRLEEWLELFAPELRYWAPVRVNVPRGQEDFTVPFLVPHFDDTLEGLQFRVARSRTGVAFAEEVTRTRHFVSNVLVLSDEGGDIKVSSYFKVFKSRQDEQWFVGAREDILRRSDDGELRIAERMILLDHAVVDSITVYI